MKRLHVHVSAADLDQSIAFYATLFGTRPTTRRPGYAKWMLEDPRINFALSEGSLNPGVSHLGLQTEDAAELHAIGARLKAGRITLDLEQDVACCYARSDKYWARDPQGIRWESVLTHGPDAIGDSQKACHPTCCP